MHAIWWAVEHMKLIMLLAVPTIAQAAVWTAPTAADVTRRERP